MLCWASRSILESVGHGNSINVCLTFCLCSMTVAQSVLVNTVQIKWRPGLFVFNSLLLKIKPSLGINCNFWQCSCPTARCGQVQDVDVPGTAKPAKFPGEPLAKELLRLKGYGSLKSFPGTCSHCSYNWKGLKRQSMLVADSKLFYSFDIY